MGCIDGSLSEFGHLRPETPQSTIVRPLAATFHGLNDNINNNSNNDNNNHNNNNGNNNSNSIGNSNSSRRRAATVSSPPGTVRRREVVGATSVRSRCPAPPPPPLPPPPAQAPVPLPPPPTPKRRSSNGATLKRSSTVDGRGGVSSAGFLLPQLDGPSGAAAAAATAAPQRKKTVNGRSGMAWLQRPEKKDKEKEKDAKPKLLIDTHNYNNNVATTATVTPSSSSSSQPSDGKQQLSYAYEPHHHQQQNPRNRSLTESPATRTSIDSAAARFNSDMRRAISSGGRLKKKKVPVSPAAQAPGKIDSFFIDRGLLLSSPRAAVEPGDAAIVGKGKKKWRKRVFSSDFFKPGGGGTENKVNHKSEKNNSQPAAAVAETAAPPKTASLGITLPTPPAPSIVSTSDNTVITKKSHDSRCSSSGTDVSQAASTVESCQVDGIGSPEVERESAGKVFNDSVIGMIDGKVGCISKMICGRQWRPPILTLDMQVLAAVDRVPVKTGRGYDLWIAVVLQGHVVGDIDFPGSSSGPNAAGIGLDVGLLLDVSYGFFPSRSLSPPIVRS